MILLLSALLGFILLFGAVVFVGPPYLPTMRRQTAAALDLLDLKPGQTLLELGSGDGRVMLAAARRGLKVVGIELNPLLVLVSRVRTWHYRKQVRIIWGGYFNARWPQADGIFTFMVQRQMPRLDRRIEQWRRGTPVRLASVAFYVPHKAPQAKQHGVLLYKYE